MITGKPLSKDVKPTLISATIRQFDGGLNVVDNDLNLTTTYAKTLDNLERGTDGTLGIRNGTQLYADLSAFTSADIINSTYFNGVSVAVTADGKVFSVLGTGVATQQSTVWHATSFVSFAQFNGQLVLCNGVDKPLLMKKDYTVVLLQDLASGSNVNVPVCRYVMTHDKYLVMAGDILNPSTMYVSNINTSGTWFGDAAPNTAVNINVGSQVPTGAATIRGLGSYRELLLILFDEAIIPVALDVYTGSPSVHTPSFQGAIQNYGSVSHRAFVSVGDDGYYPDYFGVNSLQRNLLSSGIRPERISELVDPLISAMLKNLTQASVEDKVFAVYDSRRRRYLLFVPNADNPTETVCFSYLSIKALKVEAWARLRGWNFRSGFRTQLGNVIFSAGNRLYSLLEDATALNADYVGDEETFSDETPFSDGHGLSPGGDPDGGIPIDFVWELPWTDFNKRMNLKASRYISFDTTGDAQFTCQMFVDNYFTDVNGVLNPQLSMDFIGGSFGGYGASPYGSYYGGGRPTRDERGYQWPANFRIAKLRFSGSTRRRIRFVAISLMYMRGGLRR